MNCTVGVAANQVASDATKESRHIVSLSEASGNGFKMLGVSFDEQLTMSEAVGEIVAAAGWKLRTLLRTRRFYTDADLIGLYKAHLLSFLEYRTPAVYHATRAVLDVQRLAVCIGACFGRGDDYGIVNKGVCVGGSFDRRWRG